MLTHVVRRQRRLGVWTIAMLWRRGRHPSVTVYVVVIATDIAHGMRTASVRVVGRYIPCEGRRVDCRVEA